MPTLPPPQDDFLNPDRANEAHLPSHNSNFHFIDDEVVPLGATLPFVGAGEVETTRFASRTTSLLSETGTRFRLESEIARGAMGAVYRGWDTAFGREVAVKFLLDEHLGKPELHRRFLAEARITARLQHPGIVTVFETGELPSGRPFYMMRLIKGQTLAELLESAPHTSTDRPRFLKIFEKVCEAIAYAHFQGVIHRDLKPSNVMVGDFGIVKVMDWGVAKVTPQSPLNEPEESYPRGVDADTLPPTDESEIRTQLGRVLGTPAYMSPEQALAEMELIDERTDVFALGGILCAILTGNPPYLGATARSVYQKAVRADLADAFARLEASGAGPELIALCQRCLSPDLNERPRDAGFLCSELTEYLNYDLRQAERDLVRFFELSPDLFCIAGLNGYFRRVNANFTRVLGHATHDLLSCPFIEFVHPDDRARTLAVLGDLSVGRPCVRFRNRYRDIRGEYHWFEWTAKSIPEQGIVFAVARDVTDQVHLENHIYFFGQE